MTLAIRAATEHFACVILAIIVVLASLANGSIRTPVAMTLVMSVTLLIGVVITVRLLVDSQAISTNRVNGLTARVQKRPAQQWLLAVAIAWIVYQILQITPLPGWLVSSLSPKAYWHWMQHPDAQSGSVSFTISLDPHASLFRLLLNTTMLLVVFLVRHALHKAWHAWCLLGAIVVAGIIQLLLTLFPDVGQSLACWSVAAQGCGERVAGSFINRNHHGGLLALALAALCPLLLFSLPAGNSSGWRQLTRRVLDGVLSTRLFYFLLAAALALGIYATNSRAAVLTVVIAYTVCVGLIALRWNNPSRLAFCIFVALVLTVAIGTQSSWLSERLAWSVLVEDERFAIWRLVTEMIRDYPVVGSGGGTFEQVFPAYRTGSLRPLTYDHAHNDYLQMIAEQGVIGAGLLMGIAGLFLFEAWVHWRAICTHARPLGDQRIVVAASAVCITFVVQAGVEFVNHVPSSVLIFAVALGLLGSPRSEANAVSRVK